MKKLIALAFAFVCAASISAYAGEKKAHAPLTDEQKAVMKEMTEKYDANKDGKLDKDEKAKMSDEDKAKMEKAFPHHGKKKE